MYRSSIGIKFILIIVSCFICMAVVSFLIFSDIYTQQMDAEALHRKLRAERLLALMAENRTLKDQLSWHKAFETQEDKDQLEIIRRSLFEEKGIEFTKKRLFDRTIQMVWFALVVVGVILILLVFLLRIFVTRPVERLLIVAKQFSDGDFSVRVPTRKTSFYDEIETLSLAFNRMADSLQGTLLKLEERERFLQNLIDAIPDGIRVIDQDYKEVMANKAFRKLLGQKTSGSLLCYQSSYKRQSPCEAGMVTCPLQVFKSEKNPITVIHRYLDADGHEIPVEVNAALLDYSLTSDDKEKKGILIVESVRDLGRDIRFSHQQKLSSVGLVATSVAHDLRNSLGSIRLVLENISSKNSKDLSKYIDLSKEQIGVCLDTTERLLSIGRLSDDLQKIDLTRSVQDTIALMDYESKRVGVSVEFDGKTPTLYTKGRESDVRMVFLNLFQNALNAMPRGGKLSLSLRRDNGFVEVAFKDTGIGISQDNQQRIFDPFFRAPCGKDGKSAKGGLGLGLAITRTLMKSIKGDILLESAPGKGATFTLVFPEVKK